MEYSEVITIAPMTAMISWPMKKSAPSEVWVASNRALLPGLSAKLEPAAQLIKTPRPTETRNSAPSVQ